MGAETVIEMLRKTITKNNEMEYGECKDKLPETYADMYFALYQHDKILTLMDSQQNSEKKILMCRLIGLQQEKFITNYRRTAMSFIDFCNSVGDY